ncbi:hypothetical protein GCM10023318_57310 [Nocardia callitridis]|uniref:Transposase n=1 Tax=Nocardia callitridis TaxID=648753 RepID=A0ABP9KY22_9NOCA
MLGAVAGDGGAQMLGAAIEPVPRSNRGDELPQLESVVGGRRPSPPRTYKINRTWAWGMPRSDAMASW